MVTISLFIVTMVLVAKDNISPVFGGLPEPNRACLVDVW